VNVVVYYCTYGITAPALSASYTYYIKNPAVSMDILFTGLSNTECTFTTAVTNSDGTNYDSLVFTSYTQEVLQADTFNLRKFQVVSTPILTLSTSDISKEQTYHLKMTVTSTQFPALSP